jgi:hypothetical protein
MKTLKLAVIAVFFTTALVSYANADGFKIKPTKKVMNMAFAQAIKYPDLVIAMHDQLSSDFLSTTERSYTLPVNYHNYIVRITGSYDQWAWFFRPNGEDIDTPPKGDPRIR